jgi:hypothetical protein
MRKKFIPIFFTVLSWLFASSAHAWVDIRAVTITSVIQWEGDQGVIVVLSNNVRCYIPPTDKQFISLAWLLYTTDRPADVICYDAGDNVNGYVDTHKLHRIVAYK